MSLQYGLCPTSKDAASTYPFTNPAFKFNLYAHNFLAAMGRLRLFDARLNDGVVHFDLSSQDPQRIMVKAGKAPQYGDTFFDLIRLIAPGLPIIGPKILAAIDPKSIDELLNAEITV